jgi:hypothetical protein
VPQGVGSAEVDGGPSLQGFPPPRPLRPSATATADGRPLGAVHRGLSTRGRPPMPSANDWPIRMFIQTCGHPDTSGQRPSDVIFLKDVQSDNPGFAIFKEL